MESIDAREVMETRFSPARPDEGVEVAVTYTEKESREGVVLFPPHPFLGGDMDNNILRALARGIGRTGTPVFRFNYRGVGRSKPVAENVPRYEYWRNIEESKDYRALLEDGGEALSRAQGLFRPVLLVGYSFGGFVALRRIVRTGDDLPLALISAPVQRLDFSDLNDRSAPSLLIFAENDGFDPIPPRDVFRHRFPRSRIEIIPETDHFFIGKEGCLVDLVLDFLKSSLSRMG